jgi:hypothetical protein
MDSVIAYCARYMRHALVGDYAEISANSLQTFRDYVSVQYSRVKIIVPLCPIPYSSPPNFLRSSILRSIPCILFSELWKILSFVGFEIWSSDRRLWRLKPEDTSLSRANHRRFIYSVFTFYRWSRGAQNSLLMRFTHCEVNIIRRTKTRKRGYENVIPHELWNTCIHDTTPEWSTRM